jgi:hypothetical protein
METSSTLKKLLDDDSTGKDKTFSFELPMNPYHYKTLSAINLYAIQTTPLSRVKYNGVSYSRDIDALLLNVTHHRIMSATTNSNCSIEECKLMLNQLASHSSSGKKGSGDEDKTIAAQINSELLAYVKDSKNYFNEDKSNFKLEKSAGDVTVIQYWHDAKSYSKTLLIFTSNDVPENKLYNFKSSFGDVELYFVSDTINQACDIEIEQCEDVKFLSMDVLVEVQRNLHQGQMLNMSTLMHEYDIALDMKKYAGKKDVFSQYFIDFENYRTNTKFGQSMIRKISRNGYVYGIHQTTSKIKKEIIDTDNLHVSKTGCLGSGVYCALSLPENMELLIGGHVMGLYNRANSKAELKKQDDTPIIQLTQKKRKVESTIVTPCPLEVSGHSDFLFFKARYGGNRLSNWIERFGSGRLYLEAKNAMLASISLKEKKYFNLDIKEDNYSDEFSKISKKVIDEYVLVFGFLSYMIKLSKRDISNIDSDGFWVKFNDTRKRAPTILNNIFFEVVKDYMMLHLGGEGKQWNEIGSFDMDLQYELIFKLCPSMRENWDTVKFSPDLDTMKEVFSKYHDFDEKKMQRFFYERMSFYVCQRILEGEIDLPLPVSVLSTDDLAKSLPNLAGLLFHFKGAQLYKKDAFFDKYLERLRVCEKQFRENTNLEIGIKSGSYGTEEYILHQDSQDVVAYTPRFFTNEKGHIKVEAAKPHGSLTITQRPSKTNGFTIRGEN